MALHLSKRWSLLRICARDVFHEDLPTETFGIIEAYH